MIAFIFFALAGFFNSIMDTLRMHWKISIFSNIKNPKLMDWVNPKLSWDNKWKTKKAIEERFKWSSTLLVFVTDLWHFAQLMMFICFAFGAVTYVPVVGFLSFTIYIFKLQLLISPIDILILVSVIGIAFEFFWKKIWVKK
jgi:hypothetical protein